MKFDNELVNQLIMSGYTLPEVADKLELNYQKVVSNYEPTKKKNKYIQYLKLWDDVVDRKRNNFEEVLKEKMYKNEMYNWASLSPNELEAYYRYEKKNKAYYEV